MKINVNKKIRDFFLEDYIFMESDSYTTYYESSDSRRDVAITVSVNIDLKISNEQVNPDGTYTYDCDIYESDGHKKTKKIMNFEYLDSTDKHNLDLMKKTLINKCDIDEFTIEDNKEKVNRATITPKVKVIPETESEKKARLYKEKQLKLEKLLNSSSHDECSIKEIIKIIQELEEITPNDFSKAVTILNDNGVEYEKLVQLLKNINFGNYTLLEKETEKLKKVYTKNIKLSDVKANILSRKFRLIELIDEIDEKEITDLYNEYLKCHRWNTKKIGMMKRKEMKYRGCQTCQRVLKY